MATGLVNKRSMLIRNQWVIDTLLNVSRTSYTKGFFGGDSSAIIHQVNNPAVNKEGHQVTFQNTGIIAAKFKKDKETVRGTGQSKKVFESNVSVHRWRTEVDNGDKFDAIEIGDLPLSQHADSMFRLGDAWIAARDQAFFDVAQQCASHRIVLEDGFSFKDFGYIERIIKTGYGYHENAEYKTINARRPMLESYKGSRSDRITPQYVLLIDPYMKNKLFGDSVTQSIFAQADVRGDSNRLFNGVIGKIGTNITVIEMPLFDGLTDSKVAGDFINKNILEKGSFEHQFNKHEVIHAGLRTYTGDDKAFVAKSWLGDNVGNNKKGQKLYSRGILLGAGAFKYAIGQEPTYHYAESEDYGITSSSALEVWCGVAPTILTPSQDDYPTKMGGITYGIVAIDMQIN